MAQTTWIHARMCLLQQNRNFSYPLISRALKRSKFRKFLDWEIFRSIWPLTEVQRENVPYSSSEPKETDIVWKIDIMYLCSYWNSLKVFGLTGVFIRILKNMPTKLIQAQNCFRLFQCFVSVFTARCTTVQSAVLRSHVVCPSVRLSVCDVDGLWWHRLEFFQNNFTIS